MDPSMLGGLSGKVLEFINIDSFIFDKNKNECSCMIIPKKECFNINKVFDKGLLIAIADTFSSYVVKYLCPEEDFRQYLSVRILLTSYQNIYESIESQLKMVVTLNHKIDRDIILNIEIISDKNKTLAHLSHLKRRLSHNNYFCLIE
jgi:hypothetical protein